MTGPVSPEHLEELMAGYVLGNLAPEEAEEFRQLLAERPQLATEVNRLHEALELLPYALPEVELPPHLRSSILDTVQADINRNPVRRWSRLPWSKIVGGVAALFALAIGIDNYRLRQELQRASRDNYLLQQELKTATTVINALQQPNTRVFSLVGTKEANTASGSILLDLDAQRAVVALQNLPAPPSDKIYRLWAIADNKPIACAEFNASQQGTVLDEFSLRTPACSTTTSTLAVSLEPSSLPPQPVGPIVMMEKS